MDDNPFEINQQFTSDSGLDAEAQRAVDELVADVVTDGGSIEEMIPLCVKHQGPDAPKINEAVFGYDIEQMRDRPWTKPGTVLSQYFNYGFNEKSWRLYCSMQKGGANSVVTKAEDFLNKTHGPAASFTPAGHGVPETRGGVVTGVIGGRDQGGDGRQGGRHEFGGPSGAYGGGGRDYERNDRDRDGPGSFYKTRLCFAFQKGQCMRGDNCGYAHGEHELRRRPGDGGAAGGGGYDRPYQPSHQPHMPPMQPHHQGAPSGVLDTPGGSHMPPMQPSMMPPPADSPGFRMPNPHHPHQPGHGQGMDDDVFEAPAMKRTRY